MTMLTSDDKFVINGKEYDGTHAARLLALKGMLHLELKGLKRTAHAPANK